MSRSHHLPDNLDDWPQNPYILLNVQRNVDQKGLRRAYVQLIRVFKPDHFPEQFRRIREAYEAILHWLEWTKFQPGRFSRRPKVKSPSDTAETKNARQDDEPGKADRLAIIQTSTSQFIGTEGNTQGRHITLDRQAQMSAFWRQALTGDTTAAYRQLVELELHDAGNQELCLRLYWLSKLCPEIEGRRQPHEWLLRGIERELHISPLVDLFCREIQDDPMLGLSVSCDALLKLAVDSPIVASVAQARWEAAKELDRWSIVLADIALLRPVVSQSMPLIWAQLIISAIDRLAWADDQPARATVQQLLGELDTIPEAQRQIDAAQLRFDLLRGMQAEYQRIRNRNHELAELVNLIPPAWPWPTQKIQLQLLRITNRLMQDPQAAFQVFDRFSAIAPSLAAYLVDMLRFSIRRKEASVGNESAATFQQFLRVLMGNTYQQMRPSLLDLCLHEQIAPDQLSSLPSEATHLPLTQGRSLVDQAQFDAPLCIVYYASESLWS